MSCPGGYSEAVAVSAADLVDSVADDAVHGPHVDLSASGTNILTGSSRVRSKICRGLVRMG